MRAVADTTLVAATVCVGLIAGVLGSFAVAVMPALRGASDRTFVETMHRVNVSILNPPFLLTFMGGIVLSGAAAVLYWIDDRRGPVPWVVAGFVLYLVVLVITGAVNVPLNNELDAAGDPRHIADLAAVRERFEDRWVLWNAIRSAINVGACTCLAIALLTS